MATDALTLFRENPISLLVHRFRATTPEILSQYAFLPMRDFGKWARREEKRGMLNCEPRMVHNELSLLHPLHQHRSGMMRPNVGRLSHLAKSRYSEPPVLRLVLTATDKAKRLYGGVLCGRKIRSRELDHDIALSLVFARYVNAHPELAARWVFEDSLVAAGMHCDGSKIPDAMIRGSPDTVVEFAGSYSAKKLEEFHFAFSHQPYDLW